MYKSRKSVMGFVCILILSFSVRLFCQEELVYELVEKVAAKVGIAGSIPRSAVVCFGDYVGPGYSRPTESMIEAVRMLASTEAILMDPVYTGKAMAGLIDLVRKGYFKSEENVLFVHTGGSPALHVYADAPDVVANILLGPLLGMAADLIRRVAPGGELLLSGVLVDQLPRLEGVYTTGTALEVTDHRKDGEWGGLALRSH